MQTSVSIFPAKERWFGAGDDHETRRPDAAVVDLVGPEGARRLDALVVVPSYVAILVPARLGVWGQKPPCPIARLGKMDVPGCGTRNAGEGTVGPMSIS